MDEVRWEMGTWFEGMLGARERLMVTGLISMLAVDATAKWPVAFLSEEVPVELVKEMQESDVQAGPDLQVSSMVPRPIDVTPLLEQLHLGEAWENFKWGPAAVAFVLLAALSVSLFLITQ